MKTKILYAMLCAIFALSSCQETQEVQMNLEPVLSPVVTYPQSVLENRLTTYICSVSNFDSKSKLTKAYLQIGDGYPMECTVEDGILATALSFSIDTTITFMASYWDYDSEEFRYVKESYEIKPQEPYFRTFTFGDDLDYIYSNTTSFDYTSPEQRGDALYYASYNVLVSNKKAEDFDFYYFIGGVVTGMGQSNHYDPADVFDEDGFYGMGNDYVYNSTQFNYSLTMDISLEPIEVIYAEGFVPSDVEASVIEQMESNYFVSDDESLQVLYDLMYEGKVELSMRIILNDYPELEIAAYFAVYDYTPEGKVTRDLTLTQK
ncbi:MAG: hypothetical protein R3Y61_06755 [Rikenellaceae bacterium]